MSDQQQIEATAKSLKAAKAEAISNFVDLSKYIYTRRTFVRMHPLCQFIPAHIKARMTVHDWHDFSSVFYSRINLESLTLKRTEFATQNLIPLVQWVNRRFQLPPPTPQAA